MLFIIVLLLTVAMYLALYQFKSRLFCGRESHLPKDILQEDGGEKEIMKRFEGRIPIPFLSGLKKKLVKAGFPMGAVEFLIFKALSVVITPVIAFILLGKNFSLPMLLIISSVSGFFLPDLWLNGKIKKRQHRIRRDLPNVIDLLNLCVSGGLDFMIAVNTVTRELKSCQLTRELSEVYRQTQMGKTRREALKDLALRLDMPEVHSFVRTLIQADRMGTPLAEALNLQAEEMRVRRFQYGEAMALKAPIKLLFPLFAFILPVVLIIVGGPIILQFMRGGMNISF
jgi:tight adherence protein C